MYELEGLKGICWLVGGLRCALLGHAEIHELGEYKLIKERCSEVRACA